MSARAEQLDEFYSLLDRLSDRVGGPRLLSASDSRSGWPERGVYFFFEPGEYREDGTTPRVVRVGTHALRPSRSTLWGRLSQHRGVTGGRNPGGGNHRGSIFRLHVGEALMARDGQAREGADTWGKGSSAPREVVESEYTLEREVSAYIGEMPFLWLDVDDPPSATSQRGLIERGAIALLSNFERDAIDPPSPRWLGRHSTRETIRSSGLWNVNHVRETPEGAPVLRALASFVG